jgi:hypothetical protein
MSGRLPLLSLNNSKENRVGVRLAWRDGSSFVVAAVSRGATRDRLWGWVDVGSAARSAIMNRRSVGVSASEGGHSRCVDDPEPVDLEDA